MHISHQIFGTKAILMFALCIVGWTSFTSTVIAQDRQPIPEFAPLERIIPPIESFTITYRENMIAFTEETEQRLNNLAMRLRDTNDVILLTGYSGDAQLSTHEAVRLSFARTMMIRAFLIQHGVDGKQVDLKALGQAPDDGPKDRVEIVQIRR